MPKCTKTRSWGRRRARLAPGRQARSDRRRRAHAAQRPRGLGDNCRLTPTAPNPNTLGDHRRWPLRRSAPGSRCRTQTSWCTTDSVRRSPWCSPGTSSRRGHRTAARHPAPVPPGPATGVRDGAATRAPIRPAAGCTAGAAPQAAIDQAHPWHTSIHRQGRRSPLASPKLEERRRDGRRRPAGRL